MALTGKILVFWIGGRVQEMVVYKRFQLYGFDWESFGVLDKFGEVVAYWGWLHMKVQL